MSNAAPAPHTYGFASVADLPEVTASILKNKFSEVARLTSRAPLAVTRHNRREFVILTAGQYDELQKSRLAPLESLSGEFDQLVARMNTPKAKRAVASLFAATSAGLGKAAKKARPRPARA